MAHRVKMTVSRLSAASMVLLLCRPLALPAQQNSGADAFAAIALEGTVARRGGVSEKQPPALPAIELESAKNDPRVSFPARHVMRTKEEFRAALTELKQKYRPFLEDHTPRLASTRAVVELNNFAFRFEEPEDRQDIGRAFRGEGAWQKAPIPDYRGPIGAWAGFYRTVLTVPDDVAAHELQILRFGAVDYRAQVYLNGRMVGSHTGLFSPFEIDVTRYLRPGSDNVLVVRVENDAPAIGLKSWRGPDIDGEKISAATGPGYDEPVIGWHHCPPGAGIWQKVLLEGRPLLHITDIFVRPNLDEKTIEVRLSVYQGSQTGQDVDLRVSIYPKNFVGPAVEGIAIKTMPAGPGMNEYRATLRLENFRRWQLDAPYLYTLRASLRPKKAGTADTLDAQFGMREFSMDSTSAVKGTLYLNKEPIILRGANTMGNLIRPVMAGNLDQVVEDVLIAKLANMNFFRLTQIPAQPEVYEICDRLGMMLQTDLPLFGYLRRTTLEEAVKQAGEMERLIRAHPSSIMISYINEPFSLVSGNKEHRSLTRWELERFFEAASAVVDIYNPDRVIKPVDGDYNPPAPGLPDNHIYDAWYGSHGLPIGKFIKGFWIANKDGWKHGSGEYGIEGLDPAETMFRRYPKEWLPASENDRWSPLAIPMAQTGTMHQGWFDAQDTMKEWIEASQRYQAWGVRTMTRAFRRQSDRIVSTAVHLLIDAWPSGWMKSLVDVDRNPKPAYFEYRDALTPLMVDVRTDRLHYYGGDHAELEFWIANDRRAPFETGELVWELWRNGKRVFAQSAPATIPSFGAAFQGYFRPKLPSVDQRQRLRVRAGLKSPGGDLVHDSEMEIEVFPAPAPGRNANRVIAIVGREDGRAWRLARNLGAKTVLFDASQNSGLVMVDSPEAFDAARQGVLQFVKQGGAALFLEQEEGALWRLDERRVRVDRMPRSREFVSRKTGHPLVAGFEPFDFAFWYDAASGYSEYVATSYLNTGGLKPILISGGNVEPGDPTGKPRTVVIAGQMDLGKGRIILSQLKAAERVGEEPAARAYFQAILDSVRR